MSNAEAAEVEQFYEDLQELLELTPKKDVLFMAAITTCSDFGAQKNKISHCFHYFPFYLP